MHHPLTTRVSRYGDGHEIAVFDATKNQVAVVFVNHRDAQTDYTVEVMRDSNTRARRHAVLTHPVVVDAIKGTWT